MAPRIASQSASSNLPRQESAPAPDFAKIADLLRGPRIASGTNRVAEDRR